jgi:transposase
MATRENYQEIERVQRQNRYFSEEFKKQKVKDIDNNLLTISELCKEYSITRSSVYKWIYKYSSMRKKQVKQVIETESDTRKLIELKERIKELERIIGQKQLTIDFQNKAIEIAEQEYKVDIKKKLLDTPSCGIGKTGNNSKEA